jgi:hypothetical protein
VRLTIALTVGSTNAPRVPDEDTHILTMMAEAVKGIDYGPAHSCLTATPV